MISFSLRRREIEFIFVQRNLEHRDLDLFPVGHNSANWILRHYFINDFESISCGIELVKTN